MRRALPILLLLGCAEPTPAPPIDAAVPEVEMVAPEVNQAEVELPWDQRECGECHEDQHEQWLDSAHARAWTDPHFRAEWDSNNDPFCVPCHAPLVEDPRDDPERAARGVSCEACHLVGDVVRAAAVSGEAPHASRVDPSLSTVAACEGCHQVDFPHAPGVALQNTVAEWREAGEPAGACQTCHMPESEGVHRHDVPGGSDEELLAQAIEVEVETRREAWDTMVTFTLRATGAGHAVPTGDVFRRLVVRAWLEGREDEARTDELGRHFGIPRWYELRDDRVPAPGGGDRVVELRLFSHGRPVRWSVEIASGAVNDVRHLEGVELRSHRVASGVASGVD